MIGYRPSTHKQMYTPWHEVYQARDQHLQLQGGKSNSVV